MKAFNDSTEKQFSGLASSFSLTEKSGVEGRQAGRQPRKREQAGRLFYDNTHDEHS